MAERIPIDLISLLGRHLVVGDISVGFMKGSVLVDRKAPSLSLPSNYHNYHWNCVPRCQNKGLREPITANEITEVLKCFQFGFCSVWQWPGLL